MMTAQEQAKLERMANNAILKPRFERMDTRLGTLYIAFGKPTYHAKTLVGFWAIEGAAFGPIESHEGVSEPAFRQAILEHAADFLAHLKPRGLVREGGFHGS